MKKIISIIIICMFMIAAQLTSGNASLHKAAYKGDEKKVMKYLAEGADPNEIDKYGFTPLIWAAYYGFDKIAELLLEKGANVNYKTTKEYGDIKKGSTALITASCYGFSDVVKVLLKYKADKKITNDSDENAMGLAEKNNFVAVMDLLDQGSKFQRRMLREVEKKMPASAMSFVLNNGSHVNGFFESQDKTHVKIRTLDGRINTINKEQLMMLIKAGEFFMYDVGDMRDLKKQENREQ